MDLKKPRSRWRVSPNHIDPVETQADIDAYRKAADFEQRLSYALFLQSKVIKRALWISGRPERKKAQKVAKRIAVIEEANRYAETQAAEIEAEAEKTRAWAAARKAGRVDSR